MVFADRGIEGVIFDMDGVLLDSEPLHYQVVNELLAEEGAALTLELYLEYIGTTLEDTWADLVRRFGLQRPFDYYRDRYDKGIIELYRTRSALLPGAARLVNELRAMGKRLAVASSSRTAWVEACLTCTGLIDRFDVIVTGDMVVHGKPDPEIYLQAARELGVPPARCLAFEDAPKGVEAARRAGMTVVAVETPFTAQLEIPGADLRIAGLDRFDPAWLRAAA